MIITYGPKEVPFIWSQIKPFIQRALDRGSIHTTESIYDAILDHRMQLWTYQNGGLKMATTTGISDKDCYIVTCSGHDMREWISFFSYIEEFAASQGCENLYIQGRKGWSKLLGFEIVGKDDLGLTKMRKKLCQTHLAIKTKPTETALALTR